VDVGHVVEDVLVTTKLALALPFEIVLGLGMEHTVWISCDVRNCVQSTFEQDEFRARAILVLRWRAGAGAKADRSPGDVRAGYCSSRILRLRWSRLLARAEAHRYKHERHPCDEHGDRPRERSDRCSVHHLLSVVVVGQELDTLAFSSLRPFISNTLSNRRTILLYRGGCITQMGYLCGYLGVACG